MTEVAEGHALSALVNLILVLADNKYFLGRRLSEWAPGGPSLESAVAAAALSQEELGHARALYPLLDEMPMTEAPVPLQRGDERKRMYAVSFLENPLPTWPHVVAALSLIDPALTVMFKALRECRFEDLRRRAARIPGNDGRSPTGGAGARALPCPERQVVRQHDPVHLFRRPAGAERRREPEPDEAPDLLPERGPGRRPGGPGAGVRPQAGHRPPGHQAE